MLYKKMVLLTIFGPERGGREEVGKSCVLNSLIICTLHQI
jgi:hypothetical protein